MYRRRVSDAWAFALALTYALGTAAFAINSQGLWQHGSSCLMIALGVWALDRMDVDAWAGYAVGAFAVLAVSARTATAFLAVGFMLAALARGGVKGFRNAVLGAMLPALLLMTYWLVVVKAYLPAEFQIQTSLLQFPPKLSALAGILFSPARGLFLFSPVVLFCLWGAGLLWKNPDRWLERSTIAVLLGGVLATLVLIISYEAWEGGFSFGPRYLIESVTLLFYFLPAVVPKIEAEPTVRRLWWTFVVISVVCHAMGVYNKWEWEDWVLVRHVDWNWRGYPTLFVITSLF